MNGNLIKVPATLTLEQKQSQLAGQIENDINNCFRNILSTMGRIFDRIWKNQDGLTPQQAFDSFGGNGAQLCLLFEDIKAFIVKHAPTVQLPSAPKPVTVNEQTGVVTVGE